MNKVYYKFKGHKIGTYDCVSLDPRDKVLALERGWIYLANEEGTRLRGVTCNIDLGEKIKYYDFKDLDKWVMVLGGFTSVRRQVQLANNPDLRYEGKDGIYGSNPSS